MDRAEENGSLIRAPIAVFLTWLVPGLGHIYLGHKVRGIVFLAAITLTFWTGVAIGGVRSVQPHKPSPKTSTTSREVSGPLSWWFFAQVLNGGYAMTSYAVGNWSSSADYLAWPSGDLASVYTGVAGLLNLLIIIDALARAEGLPLLTRSSSGSHQSTGPPGRKGRRRD